MIDFGSVNISISDIQSIQSYDSNDQNYPFGLKIKLKNGDSFSRVYGDERNRDNDRTRIVMSVRKNRTASLEIINNRLYNVEWYLKSIERRQKRLDHVLKGKINVESLDE